MTEYLVTDDNGLPLHFTNFETITTEGASLAMAMAAASHDKDAVMGVCAAVLDRVGPDMYGYVIANAAIVLATDVLSPALDVAAAHGTDLRAGIAAIARGEQPT